LGVEMANGAVSSPPGGPERPGFKEKPSHEENGVQYAAACGNYLAARG
jgi:hypothetical protein